MRSKVSSTLRLEVGLHRRQRDGILEIVLVVEAVGRRRLALEPFRRRLRRGRRRHAVAGRIGRRRRAGGGIIGLRRLLAVGAGVGRLEIDDVAQQDLGVVEFVAPDDDRLEGERAFAQARDHRLAAGLDPLGDGDFALARQELDRAHLAQIHAHRIVGALGRLGTAGGDRRRAGAPRRVRRLRPLPRRRPSALSLSASSASSLSTTLMPISLSIAFMSSIWSDEISSDGRTAFSSSCVTQPRFLAILSIRLTAASLRSSSGLSGVSTTAASPSPFASSFFAIAASPSFRGQGRRVFNVVTDRPSRASGSLKAHSVRAKAVLFTALPLKPAIPISRAGPFGSDRGRYASGLIAKTVDGCFRIRKVSQIRFDIKQSGKIKLVWLRCEQPLRELQVPM